MIELKLKDGTINRMRTAFQEFLMEHTALKVDYVELKFNEMYSLELLR